MSPKMNCLIEAMTSKSTFIVITVCSIVFIILSYSDVLMYNPIRKTVKMKNVTESTPSQEITYKSVEREQVGLLSQPVELFPEPFMLGNIPNFTYVLNRDICKKEPVDLLVLIGSHPGHNTMRKVLRDTWGAVREDRYNVKLMFPIGRPNDSVLQQQMIDECAAYGDVVQGNFEDDYRSVTIRDLMSLHWAWTQCPQARFVMHIDDDICMDIDHMFDALEEQMPKDKDYVACFSHFYGGEVLRDGRYGLSAEEHPNNTYDHYCSGWAYWLTIRAAKYLDKAALRNFPYRINDAYLTGTLMTDLGWEHLTLEIQVSGNPDDFVNYLNSSDDTAPKYFMGYNGMNETLTQLVHEKFHRYSIKNGIPSNIHTKSTASTTTANASGQP